MSTLHRFYAKVLQKDFALRLKIVPAARTVSGTCIINSLLARCLCLVLAWLLVRCLPACHQLPFFERKNKALFTSSLPSLHIFHVFVFGKIVGLPVLILEDLHAKRFADLWQNTTSHSCRFDIAWVICFHNVISLPPRHSGFGL